MLVKDAQRHGLRVKPIDVQISEWACTIEHETDGSALAAAGPRLCEGTAASSLREAIVATRAAQLGYSDRRKISSARVPSLNRKELTLLARIGALNNLDGIEHRRDALWQVERAGKLEGPLLRQNERTAARGLRHTRLCSR